MRWPGLFDDVDSSLESWIVDQMHIVRFWFYIVMTKIGLVSTSLAD